jgi:hypothetical protein
VQSYALWLGSQHRKQHEGFKQSLVMWSSLKQLKHKPIKSIGTLLSSREGFSTTLNQACLFFLLVTRHHPSSLTSWPR